MARDPSAHYDSTIPQGWGPGPWDQDYRPGWSAAYHSGDLRAWSPGDPVAVVRHPITISGRHDLGPLIAPRRIGAS